MCKVACGIDSQVVGEQEIFGQFKNAYKTADELGLIKSRLRLYIDKTLEISKKISLIDVRLQSKKELLLEKKCKKLKINTLKDKIYMKLSQVK